MANTDKMVFSSVVIHFSPSPLNFQTNDTLLLMRSLHDRCWCKHRVLQSV